jgi:CO/xanthine dehydrogenase FAD-binding subunit
MRTVRLPGSLSELWELLDETPDAMVYAGGTDLLVKMRGGLVNPGSLICLERVEELKGVIDLGGSIRIGACTTHTQLLNDPPIRNSFPVLKQALSVLGSPLVRNMGTIGGNLCTASPAGDTLPPLYALGAEVELKSRRGARQMRIADFITGPGKTRLGDGEILAAIHVAKPPASCVHHFEKVGLRNALACSVVSLAALLDLSPDGVVKDVALAWGSVGPTIISSPEAEAALRGGKLTREALHEAARLTREAVSPITDLRADADYRRTVAANLLFRLALVGGVM